MQSSTATRAAVREEAAMRRESVQLVVEAMMQNMMPGIKPRSTIRGAGTHTIIYDAIDQCELRISVTCPSVGVRIQSMVYGSPSVTQGGATIIPYAECATRRHAIPVRWFLTNIMCPLMLSLCPETIEINTGH